MHTKAEMIDLLKEEFKTWQESLAMLTEEELYMPEFWGYMTVKDVVAHLWKWQERSILRMESAAEGTVPTFDPIFEGLSPDDDDNVDDINFKIYEAYKDKPWEQVFHDWKSRFERFIELSEATPEADLFDKQKYPWLNGYCLYDVLAGSYEHHHVDHLPPLLELIGQ